jgi:hypothetical protein
MVKVGHAGIANSALRIAYFIHEKKSAMESVDLRECVREFIKIFE